MAGTNQNVVETKRDFPILKILWKNLFLIIIVTVLVFGAMFLLTSRQASTTYTAKTNVILSITLPTERDDELNLRNDITLAQKYMQTVQYTIKSRAVADKAQEIYNGKRATNTKLPKSWVSFGSVGTSNNKESLIFQIRYVDGNEDASRAKLDSVIEAANIEFKNDPFLKEAEIELIPTQTGEYPVSASQNLVSSGLKYALIGLVVGVVIAFARYFLDNKLKDEKELQDIAGVAFLGYIEKQ